MMKQYLVEFEQTDGTLWSKTFRAEGRSDAENRAESYINLLFFSDRSERSYFYTLTEVGTDKRRVIKAMNVMAPRKPF
jgi:hypothetical protein